MPSTTRPTWAAALVAAATLTVTTLTVAGCGGDDDVADAGDTAAAGQATLAPSESETTSDTTTVSTATTTPPAGDLDAWCLGWYSLTISTGNPGPLLLELDEVTPAELRDTWEAWWPNEDSQEWRDTNRELDRYFAANCRGRVQVGTPITQP